MMDLVSKVSLGARCDPVKMGEHVCCGAAGLHGELSVS